MEYIFNGEFSRQDAINTNLIQYINNKFKMAMIVPWFVIIYILVNQITLNTWYTSDILINIFTIVLFIIVAISVLYFSIAIRSEIEYKESNLRSVESVITEHVMKRKTNLSELEVKTDNVVKIMYSKNYVVLIINDNGTRRAVVLKKNWLSSVNNWNQFKIFIKENWDPRTRV